MKPAIIVVGAALLLSGCALKQHMQERDAARDDARCRSYGAAPGTDAYITCRAQADASRRAAAGAFMGGVIQNQPRSLPAQAAPPRLCNWVGNTVSCN